MSVKKFISVILISVAFCLIFNVTKAATAEELLKEIARLQALIAQLQKQLAEIQGKPTTWCHDFNTNLKYGDRFGDVGYLQSALEKEGFSISEDEKMRNYFGDFTASAVVGFQEKYKDEILTPVGLTHGTGFVGPATRAKLNKLYGCGVVPPPEKPYIKVLSPNGGEIYKRGDPILITWKTNSKSKLVMLDIRDEKNVSYGKLAQSPVPNTGSYTFNLTYNLPEGRYKIIAFICPDEIGQLCWRDIEGLRKYGYDESDNYFSIVSAVTGCIDSDSSSPDPEYIKGYVIKNGVKYEDVCYGVLNHLQEYYCGWDGSVKISDVACPYGCKDGACLPGITLISPNGGEKWVKGNTYEIRWKAEGINRIGIDVVNFDTNTVYTLVTAPNDLPASLGKYSWKVGSEYPEIPPGDHYKIRIFTTFPQEFISDESDGYFSIVSAPEKSITVLSPNGGEKWVFGIPQTITWSSVGIDKVVIYLWFPDGATCKLADNVPAADGKYTITIKENQQCPNIPRTITAGQYKIGVWSVEPALDISAPHDYSDNYFSIVSGGTPIGSLSVSLSPDIPRNQTFIKGQKEAKLAKINFTAGPEEDIKVILVEINIDKDITDTFKTPEGGDLKNIKLVKDDGTLFGTVVPDIGDLVISGGSRLITMSGSLIVKAGSTASLTLVADIPSTTLANSFEFSIPISGVSGYIVSYGVTSGADIAETGGADQIITINQNESIVDGYNHYCFAFSDIHQGLGLSFNYFSLDDSYLRYFMIGIDCPEANGNRWYTSSGCVQCSGGGKYCNIGTGGSGTYYYTFNSDLLGQHIICTWPSSETQKWNVRKSMGYGLKFIEDQLASISQAASWLIEQLKKLIGR